MNTDAEIKILDLGEAAALKSSGFELIRLEPTHRPRQRAFVFPSTIERSILGSETLATIKAFETVERYAKRELTIEARGYYEAIRSLKSRLHDDLDAS